MTTCETQALFHFGSLCRDNRGLALRHHRPPRPRCATLGAKVQKGSIVSRAAQENRITQIRASDDENDVTEIGRHRYTPV